MYQHKGEDEAENQFNKDFENTCDWFVHKLICFASKRRSKNTRQLNIRYSHIIIRQHSEVTHLWCMLDKTMLGEPMALKVINKINGKLKFLYRKNRNLTKKLHRILCNGLILPHFVYACPAWYPNLNEKMKKKIQIMQNKCIRFCLKLDKMHLDFRSINWLPTSKRVDQYINTIPTIVSITLFSSLLSALNF